MPQWDRKDHNRIARILNNRKPSLLGAAELAWNGIVEEFAAAFEIDSPFFEKERFLNNCGYEPVIERTPKNV